MRFFVYRITFLKCKDIFQKVKNFQSWINQDPSYCKLLLDKKFFQVSSPSPLEPKPGPIAFDKSFENLKFRQLRFDVTRLPKFAFVRSIIFYGSRIHVTRASGAISKKKKEIVKSNFLIAYIPKKRTNSNVELFPLVIFEKRKLKDRELLNLPSISIVLAGIGRGMTP